MRLWPVIKQIAKEKTSQEYEWLEYLTDKQREAPMTKLINKGRSGKPIWWPDDASDKLPAGHECYVTNEGSPTNRNPIRVRLSVIVSGQSRHKILYSYQYMYWYHNRIISNVDLVISHLCHNSKCHRYKHLVLEPAWLNNKRQHCKERLLNGEFNFTCNHPGTGCIKDWGFLLSGRSASAQIASR